MQKQEAEIFIHATPERVYDFISDWRNTPRYERYIARIERMEPLSDGQCLAECHLTLLGLTIKSRHRYWFAPPTNYGGMQLSGLVRGGFWFRLRAEAGGTRLVHGEFVVSRWPVLEWLTAFVLWKVCFPSDIQHQLTRLKGLLECDGSDHGLLPSARGLGRFVGRSLLE